MRGFLVRRERKEAYILIRLSFFGAAFLRASWEDVDEKGAIRFTALETLVGVLLRALVNALLHVDVIVGIDALVGSWNALAREILMEDAKECISAATKN